MRLAFVAFDADQDLVTAALEMDAVGVDADLDLFGVEDFADDLRGVFVFFCSEAGGFVDDGDLGAEAAKHLGELEANGASAHHDEVLGEHVEIEEGGAGEKRDGIDAGHFGNEGPRSNVEKDFRRFKQIVSNAHGGGRCEGGRAGENGAVGIGAEALLDASAGAEDDGVFPGFDGAHVDGDGAGLKAEIGAAAREVSGMGVGHHGFGGGASVVDAGPAEEMTLDRGYFPSGGGEAGDERRAGLARANDDCVKGVFHAASEWRRNQSRSRRCLRESLQENHDETRQPFWHGPRRPPESQRRLQ